MSKELTNLFSKKVNKQEFSKIKITLASPDKIRSMLDQQVHTVWLPNSL